MTDDVRIIKFRTEYLSDAKKVEKLNNLFFKLTTGALLWGRSTSLEYRAAMLIVVDVCVCIVVSALACAPSESRVLAEEKKAPKVKKEGKVKKDGKKGGGGGAGGGKGGGGGGGGGEKKDSGH